MNKRTVRLFLGILFFNFLLVGTAQAAYFTITPKGTLPTSVQLNVETVAEYTVENTSGDTTAGGTPLAWVDGKNIKFIRQETEGAGVCDAQFSQLKLPLPDGSCILRLKILVNDASVVNQFVHGVPKICDRLHPNVCSDPASTEPLNAKIMSSAPVVPVMEVTPAEVTLQKGGQEESITVKNVSASAEAKLENITATTETKNIEINIDDCKKIVSQNEKCVVKVKALQAAQTGKGAFKFQAKDAQPVEVPFTVTARSTPAMHVSSTSLTVVSDSAVGLTVTNIGAPGSVLKDIHFPGSPNLDMEYKNCTSVGKDEKCIITIKLAENAALSKEVLALTAGGVDPIPIQVQLFPQTVTEEKDPKLAHVQYKSIKFTNHAVSPVHVKHFTITAQPRHFLVCNQGAKAQSQCADFTRSTELASQSCFLPLNSAPLTLKKDESCYVWLRPTDVTPVDQLTNENTPPLKEAVKFKIDLVDPLQPNLTYSLPLQATLLRNVGLYLGGNFDLAGGTEHTSRIAYFDGLKFYPVGGGIDPTVDNGNTQINALEMFNGDLYAGGKFTKIGNDPVASANNIAYWDEKEWKVLSTLDNANANGTNAPVNVLKAWKQPDLPSTINKAKLVVGFDWGIVKGYPFDRMLALWYGEKLKWGNGTGTSYWQEGGSATLCALPRIGQKWSIRSLAITNIPISGGRAQNMMVGGSFCIDTNSSMANRSFGLRSMWDNSLGYGPGDGSGGYRWGYNDRTHVADVADKFAQFLNAPVGYRASPHTQHNAPDVYALYTLKVGNQERLLVGGDDLVSDAARKRYLPPKLFESTDLPSSRRTIVFPRRAISVEYSDPNKPVLVMEPNQTWAYGQEHAIRAFASGLSKDEPDTFYAAGRDLVFGSYIAKGFLPPDGMRSVTIDWHPIQADWTYSDAHKKDIILSLANLGDTLYVGGRFTDAGNSVKDIHNIAVLDPMHNVLLPLKTSTGTGVTRNPAGTATVNALLPATSLTIGDIHIG